MSELEAEYRKTRSEVATYLREFADELDASGVTDVRSGTTDSDREDASPDANADADDRVDRKVTLVVGNDSATVNPPSDLDFLVEVNSDSALMESGEEQSVTFTLRWAADEVAENDELDVT